MGAHLFKFLNYWPSAMMWRNENRINSILQFWLEYLWIHCIHNTNKGGKEQVLAISLLIWGLKPTNKAADLLSYTERTHQCQCAKNTKRHPMALSVYLLKYSKANFVSLNTVWILCGTERRVLSSNSVCDF